MSYERIVELNRWPGIGFGFSVIGGSDTHIPPMICALVRDSPALLSKQVYVGDLLFKVNGINVTALETKQVVDLIRNCKKSIILSLKEDRLAKLKARPFLAEDSLIDPPRTTAARADHHHHQQNHQRQQHHLQHQQPGGNPQHYPSYIDPRRTSNLQQNQQQRKHHPQQSRKNSSHPSSQRNHDNQLSRTRTVGSSKSYEHGTDGRYEHRNSNCFPNQIDLSSTHDYYSPQNPQKAGSNNRSTENYIRQPDGRTPLEPSSRTPANLALAQHPQQRYIGSGGYTNSDNNSSKNTGVGTKDNKNSKMSSASIGGGDKRLQANKQKSSSPPNTVTAHVYTLHDAPLSPRYYSASRPQFITNTRTEDNTTYQSLVNKRQGEEYVSYRFRKNEYANAKISNSETSIPKAASHQNYMQQQHLHHPANNYRQKMGKKYFGSFDTLDYYSSTATTTESEEGHSYFHSEKSQYSAPPYNKIEGKFDFSDGSIQSCITPSEEPFHLHHKTDCSIDNVCSTGGNNNNTDNIKNRPYSNPEILDKDSREIDSIYTNNPSSQLNISVGGEGGGMIGKSHHHHHHQNSNYSSPSIYDDSERMHSEHKALTLTPVSHSVCFLSTPEGELNAYDHDESFLAPLSITTTPHNNSAMSSSAVSPISFLAESELSNSMSSNMTIKQEISPADIASRLFTLNGYKDTDVAPLLGKNSDFSQQICREYLQFFQFEGIALDEAIRLFLGKFPLTGETQERERILIHFSKRYHECNEATDMDEDSIHTLICALMLLNTDLHGHSISNRMTFNDFVTNLSGLRNGKDFQKEYLKTLYNSIKSKEIIFARARTNDTSPKSRRKNSAPGNPFIELKVDSKDAVICEGLVYRKSVMDLGGRRTPLMRRNWRPFYCVLRGLVILSYKPDHVTAHDPQSIGIHHALAGYAKDYKKRMFVFKLITADWSVYYIQVKNQEEVKKWMDSINVSAALLSSPPLPAPCGSSLRFQRPVMPVSRTRLSPKPQLVHHKEKIKTLEEDLALHLEYRLNPSNKHYQDWEEKNDYLEFEVKRFEAYISVLTIQKLGHVRERILANAEEETAKKAVTAPNGKVTGKLTDAKNTRTNMRRSSSMHSLSTMLNLDQQQEIHNEKSYSMGGSP